MKHFSYFSLVLIFCSLFGDDKILFADVKLYQFGQIIKNSKLKQKPKSLSKNHNIKFIEGDTVKIIDYTNEKFAQVEIAGWIYKNNLRRIPKQNDSDQFLHFEITKGSKLKKHPKYLSKTYNALFKIGEVLEAIDTSKVDFIKIVTQGWVSKKRIKLIDIDDFSFEKKFVQVDTLAEQKQPDIASNVDTSSNFVGTYKILNKKKKTLKKHDYKNTSEEKYNDSPNKETAENNVSYLPYLFLSILCIYITFYYRSKIKEIKLAHDILVDKLSKKYNAIREKFDPIISVEDEVERINDNYQNLKADYKKGYLIYDKLKNEINSLSDELDLMSNGLYEPKYDFGTSDQYKDMIKSIRSRQKELIKRKKAIPPNYNWTINNNRQAGKAFINRTIRISLRAFNGECDSVISKVRWNNVERMELRIEKSKDAIDKFLGSHDMQISDDYLISKLHELHAVHEYLEKIKEEKDEIRRIRAEEREEKKVLQEIENAKKEAEKEEKIYNKALDKARQQLGILSGKDLVKHQEQIQLLEQKLEEALAKKERAISRAQLTKSGHVYIISNIGSFGSGIFKIGLTRRLEPEIRVRELGGASVPFGFDIHAMIFSEDAPALERSLHDRFNSSRVNLANNRKEYFKLEIDEIKSVVKEIDPKAEFISTVESREYKETLQQLKQKEKQLFNIKNAVDEKFPQEL